MAVTVPLRVKVCGITDARAARAAAGADRAGLVFAPSPRRIDPRAAARLVEAVDAEWVGVFVDPDPDVAVGVAARLDLAAIQLHGSESPETCRRIREASGREVWKAVRWDAPRDAVEAWGAACDALLVDAVGGPRPGGTGRILPWEDLAARWARDRRPAPMILAGGLGPDNVREAIETVDPDGVDASSRLEIEPGRKDPDLVRAFVDAARAASRSPEGAR